MVRIELSETQAEDLRKMLEGWLGDLRMEVSQTDRKTWRDHLKRREDLVKLLLRQLAPAPPPGESEEPANPR